MKTTRRQALFGAASAALGSSLLLGGRASAGGPSTGRHLIVVYASGGWDTTYALDPKVGAGGVDPTEGQVRTFGDLPILVDPSRPAVTSFFEAWGEACAVVRGIGVQSIVHSDCSKRILTGTADERNPDVCAIAAATLAPDLPAPYLALGPTAYTGPLTSYSARVGSVNQIRSLIDPDLAFPPDGALRYRLAPDGEEAALVRAYLDQRTARQRALRGVGRENRRRLEDLQTSIARSDRLRGFSGGFGEEFSFTVDMREQIRIGLDAIEQGVCHSLHLEDGFAGWDTHTYNADQGVLHENLFSSLAVLAQDLADRPGAAAGSSLLDETVVAVVSEMGRTPRVNVDGGKDHWPVTSALVFGGGVRGGRAYGATTDDLLSSPVDYATGEVDADGEFLGFANFAAGLLKSVGVEPGGYLDAEPFDAFLA